MNENLLKEKEMTLSNQEVRLVDLTSSIKSDAVLTLEELNLFKFDVEEKKNSILTRTSQIKERVNELDVVYPGLREKSKIQDIFDSTTKDYMQLIEITLKEIDFFINICQSFCEPYKVRVEATDGAVYAYVENELKGTKRYLKSRKKDLAVFFSRYDYGFNMHMSRLNMISQAASSHSKN